MTLKVLLRDDIRSAFVTYVGYSVVLLAVAAYFFVTVTFAVAILDSSFPLWMSGETPANHFRNVLEILYFLANIGILLVAVIAGSFAYKQSLEARRQAGEAERIRKIQVYMKIIDMWNSTEVVKSRRVLLNMAREHLWGDYRVLCKPDDYIAFFLKEMRTSRNLALLERYQKALTVLDLLEYVGNLCREGELDLAHVLNFLGSQIAQVIEDLTLSHICQTRARYRSASNYANVLFILEERQRLARDGPVRYTVPGYGVSSAN